MLSRQTTWLLVWCFLIKRLINLQGLVISFWLGLVKLASKEYNGNGTSTQNYSADKWGPIKALADLCWAWKALWSHRGAVVSVGGVVGAGRWGLGCRGLGCRGNSCGHSTCRKIHATCTRVRPTSSSMHGRHIQWNLLVTTSTRTDL